MSEENIINNMADEAKSVEELLGRYQQWPENGRSVARDVARRYLIIRDERDALKDELDQARAALSSLYDEYKAARGDENHYFGKWDDEDMVLRVIFNPPGQEA